MERKDPYLPSKSLYHLDKLASMREGIPFAPSLIQVDPEAYCNDNCSFCSYREENMYNNIMLKLISAKPGDARQPGPVGKPTERSGWPIEFADSIPAQMEDIGIKAIEITGGGEPTLWRGFDRLVENCQSRNIECGVVTNGSQITDRRAELLARCVWVRFSIDAPSQEVHQKVHRTINMDFRRRIDGISKVVEVKKSLNTQVTIGVSYIINPDNVDHIEDMCRLAQNLGVDNLRFSFMYDKTGRAGLTDSQYEEVVPRLETMREKYSIPGFRILFDGNRLSTFSQPNDDFVKCYIQKLVWAIGADCKVYPCCIQKYIPGFELADLRKKTLREVMEDSLVMSKQDSLDPKGCFPCWMRERNKAIARTQEKPEHENFL